MTKYETVAAANYKHYTLGKFNGNLKIILNTIDGDADLYIKEGQEEKANFENYDISSATCGYDYIDIPASLSKPLSISVYGHPTYDNSTFELKVITYRLDNDDSFVHDDVVDDDETRGSLLMMILEFIFEILFDVLV
ncbi:UPF0669 protein v1g209471-like [Antedon mediterranea]|uniref:UPF0669 protein v1g209471-like n=1 Tax=Antedon mediterranea TaxID=105859 RepID=UPI003AF748FB